MEEYRLYCLIATNILINSHHIFISLFFFSAKIEALYFLKPNKYGGQKRKSLTTPEQIELIFDEVDADDEIDGPTVRRILVADGAAIGQLAAEECDICSDGMNESRRWAILDALL